MADSSPFVVSVIASKSFTAGASQRIYSTQLVWANGAPKSIHHALESHDVAAIKKHYGADILEETSPPPKTAHGGDDEFTVESLGEALEEAERKRAAELVRQRTGRFVAPRQVAFNRRTILVKDITILWDDNMLVLKKKIQLASGIPTYRQYLWYEQDGFVFSPCFNFYIDDRRVHVNIWDLRDQTSYVLGVPVSTAAYAERGRIRVRNTEFTTTLGGICEIAPAAQWFVVDLNDFFPDRKQVADAIKSDIYIRDLIYYSFVIRYWPCIVANVFQIYMANEPILHDEYPELSYSQNVISRQLLLESAIVSANPRPSPKKWPMTVYIEESDLTVVNEYYSYGSVINLRNLFDTFKLTPETPYMICRTGLAGRLYTLTKQYRAPGARWEPSQKQRPTIDSLIIMTIITVDGSLTPGSAIGEMFVHVESSGAYHIRTKWREDAHMSIDTVTEKTIIHGNKIIARINALGESIAARPLVLMTADNIDVIDTSVVMIIQKKLSLAEFESVKANAAKFKQAGLIIITSLESNEIVFHLLKGMYDYDDAHFDAISNTTNGYEYATSITTRQRWEPVYLRQKSSIIVNRAADIFIKATGIHYGEISAFIKYMLILIQMTEFGTSADTAISRSVRAITQLKEADPLLYDLKKLYKQKTQYSQICQRPNQPILVDKPTKRSIKFWNFTKREPAYYECPRPEFPSLYFKTGIHPEGYCIPCCKKSELAEGSKHERIYAQCIKDHVFAATDKSATSVSSYIVSFTSDLEPGRLSYLPESSLDQLFYQQYSSTSKPVDAECIPDLGYYVYGVSQEPVALASCLANALGLGIADFIEQTTARLTKKDSENLWPLVLEGRITSWFKAPADFIGALNALSSKSPEGRMTDFDHWNDAFAYIARLYWGINVILFVTKEDGSVAITIPPNIKHIDEIVSTRHRHLIVIAIGAIYLPIYLINIPDYKSTGQTAQTLFKTSDKAIEIIRRMIIAIIGETTQSLDLEQMLEFLDSHERFSLATALINRRNICYAILLLDKSTNAQIYWPITNSLHDHLDLNRQVIEFDRRNYTVTLAQTESVIAAFNAWKNGPMIAPAVWLLLGDKVIGFQDGGRQYNYYIAPISRAEAEAAHSLQSIHLLYDPTVINALIDSAAGAPSQRPGVTGFPSTAQCLYDHYKYQLFTLEFISVMDKQINTPIRDAIATIIRRDIKTSSILFHNLKVALAGFDADYEYIVAIFGKFAGSFSCGTSEYNSLIGNKRATYDANTIISIIGQSRFSFDDEAMAALEALDHANLVSRLDGLLSPMIEKVATNVVVDSFPKAITSCATKVAGSKQLAYCNASRLKISAADYELFKEQLARDIKNPLKKHKLMILATRATTNELSFTNHPDEHIYVHVE